MPIKSKGEVLQADKQFAKEIGEAEAIICDTTGEQTSNDLHKFCRDIVTALRVLEYGTPWANKYEFHIGLIKGVFRRDINRF